MDLSTLLSIIRLTELKESKRNAILSLIVQLSFAYFIALVIVSRFVGFVNYIIMFIIILSLILLIIITDISMKKYVLYTIDTLIETLNLKINGDNNIRQDIINAVNILNDKNKLYDLINKLIEKDNIERKQLGRLIVSSVISNFAHIILLSLGFVLLNEVYTNLFSYRYIMISVFTLIVSYMLLIRSKIISSKEDEQIKYESFTISYISLLINRMLNTKFTKNKSTTDKIIYYLFTYIGVPLSMYTVVNSFFSVDSNNNPQKTPDINLIYIIDHEELDKCGGKVPEERRMKCEENIGSFLSYMAEKVGAKSLINMNKKEFTELVCDRVKNFKKEENNKLFTLLCNKDSSPIAPYDLGNIKIYMGHLYFEESYTIERVLRNTEILNNSIILLTRVGKSISFTSLIRLRVKLSIGGDYLLYNKGRSRYQEEHVNCECNLDLAIFYLAVRDLL